MHNYGVGSTDNSNKFLFILVGDGSPVPLVTVPLVGAIINRPWAADRDRTLSGRSMIAPTPFINNAKINRNLF